MYVKSLFNPGSINVKLHRSKQWAISFEALWLSHQTSVASVCGLNKQSNARQSWLVWVNGAIFSRKATTGYVLSRSSYQQWASSIMYSHPWHPHPLHCTVAHVADYSPLATQTVRSISFQLFVKVSFVSSFFLFKLAASQHYGSMWTYFKPRKGRCKRTAFVLIFF